LHATGSRLQEGWELAEDLVYDLAIDNLEVVDDHVVMIEEYRASNDQHVEGPYDSLEEVEALCPRVFNSCLTSKQTAHTSAHPYNEMEE
jgi:hypothetical protein